MQPVGHPELIYCDIPLGFSEGMGIRFGQIDRSQITDEKKARREGGLRKWGRAACLNGLRQHDILEFYSVGVVAFVFGHAVTATQALIEFIHQ